MWTRQHQKSPLRYLVVPVLSALLFSYFSFHALTGNHGLESKQVYETRLTDLRSELATLNAHRGMLEQRVAALSDGTLQRDMIDEQARRQLGLVSPNEVIIFHDAAIDGITINELVRRSN